MTEELTSSDYLLWIQELKSKIHAARSKVALSVNAQLIELYWTLGKDISEKLSSSVWGSSFIDQIAIDLKHEFPDIKGFSRRNLYAISQWYKFYSRKFEFVPQLVAQIPWGHNRLIITKVNDIEEALFYCRETARNGWNRDILEIQIENKLFKKIGHTINNFDDTLPANQVKLVSETLKDPYNFDFLGLQEDALEKAIEDQLTRHITDFLLELGKGFAFLGRQFKIEIGESDYYILPYGFALLHCD
jgi:predicted nuclease of restriction endonuclease-like (RecB) superfamily